MRRFALSLLCGSTVASAIACGGNVVLGTGGSGGSSSSTTGTTTSTTSATGTGGSADHDGGAVGAPCQASTGCASPETCVTSVPGGYCTVVIAECSGDPFNPGTCPPGSWCVNGIMFGTQGGDFCLARCNTAADCRQAEGYVCNPWGDAGVCFYGQGFP